MEPITKSKFVQYRAILAIAKEVLENKKDAEVHETNWLDSEPTFKELEKDAKEFGCDLIQIETVTTETKVFEVK